MAARDMDAADAPAALTGSMALLLRQAARQAADGLSLALAPLGLHERHFGILLALADDGPATQNGLGQRLGIDRTTMVAAIDHLERLSYVVRRPHPTDRRANSIELTGRGRGRLVRATGAASAAEFALLADLAPAEVELLKALLARVVQPGHAPIQQAADGAPPGLSVAAPDQDTPAADRPQPQEAHAEDAPAMADSMPAEDAAADEAEPPI